MFPTNLEHPYSQRVRRRGRADPNSRDYICPCGKSYLSYPALFTHIKIKHNGRAPGQVIKPRSENISRRGRPRARELYDTDSDSADIAANCIDRLCDFLMEVDKWDDNGKIKEMYLKEPFYETYVNFNPQEQEPKYDDMEDLYQQSCDNVFCQFLAEINKRINEPYYFDVLFAFFVMLTKSIEDKEEENSGSDMEKEKKSLKNQPIRSIVTHVNTFLMESVRKYRIQLQLQNVALFQDINVAKLIQLLFDWLTMKKYICFRVKINPNFSFENMMNIQDQIFK